MRNNVKTTASFYKIITIDNGFMTIVKSNLTTCGIKEILQKRLINSEYLTVEKLEVKSCENALILPHALDIIRESWIIITEKKRRYKVSRTEQCPLSVDTLKYLHVRENHIEVSSFYNESGGASKEYRLFKLLVDICDNLDITLDYAHSRNIVFLRSGDQRVKALKCTDGIEFIFERWEEETYVETIKFWE